MELFMDFIWAIVPVDAEHVDVAVAQSLVDSVYSQLSKDGFSCKLTTHEIVIKNTQGNFTTLARIRVRGDHGRVIDSIRKVTNGI